MGSLTHRPQSRSFLGLPYRVLNMNPKKELLRGLWVGRELRGSMLWGSRVRSVSQAPGGYGLSAQGVEVMVKGYTLSPKTLTKP